MNRPSAAAMWLYVSLLCTCLFMLRFHVLTFFTSRQRFWATVCKTVRPMLSVRCLSVLSVCDVGVLWPNDWMDQDVTWYGGRPRPRPHCVRWGPSCPSPKGAQPPPQIFGPCLLWPKGWMDQYATWCEGRRRPRRHCVRWGPSFPKGTQPLIFGPYLLWPNGRPC